MKALLTKADLFAALAGVDSDTDILMGTPGCLCPIRAELNVVPPLVDTTGMSTLEPIEGRRVILVPNDSPSPTWPGGVTTHLEAPGVDETNFSDRIVRLSQDGLTQIQYIFFASVQSNTLRVHVSYCAAITSTRASKGRPWRKGAHWAAYNKASNEPRPALPRDVANEVRQRILSHITVEEV